MAVVDLASQDLTNTAGAYDHIRKRVTHGKLQAITLYLIQSPCSVGFAAKIVVVFWRASCAWPTNQSMTEPRGVATRELQVVGGRTPINRNGDSVTLTTASKSSTR